MRVIRRVLTITAAAFAVLSGPAGCGPNKGTEEPTKYTEQPKSPPVGAGGGTTIKKPGEKGPRAGASGASD